MLSTFLIVFFLLGPIDTVQHGRIDRAYLSMLGSQYSVRPSRWEDCVCQTFNSNGSIKAWNYYQNNQTCQFFLNDTSLDQIQSHNDAAIGFLSALFLIDQPTIRSRTLVNHTWTFDGMLNDQTSMNNGAPMNNPSFFSPGITGYGSALSFNQSLNQSVMFDSTRNLNLSFSSFTFELWIYLYSFADGFGDRGLIGQCESFSANRCLHLTIRGNQVRMSFFANACPGSTRIVTNRWYHLAFVYDSPNNSQAIYIDGILDCFRSGSPPLQIANLSIAQLTIGVTYPLSPFYYDGLIDEVSVVGWAKNASEILDDATLIAYYPFHQNTSDDRITAADVFYSNSSLLFNSSLSYVQLSPLILLGTSNRSYSLSLWIYPLSNLGSMILHGFQSTSVCMTFFSFSTLGNIIASSRSAWGSITVTGPNIPLHRWTHIVQTYSSLTGLSLYVNGTLIGSSAPFVYQPNGQAMILTLGNTNTLCNTGPLSVLSPPYYGWIDEVRIYSRILTTSDIRNLATHPI